MTSVTRISGPATVVLRTRYTLRATSRVRTATQNVWNDHACSAFPLQFTRRFSTGSDYSGANKEKVEFVTFMFNLKEYEDPTPYITGVEIGAKKIDEHRQQQREFLRQAQDAERQDDKLKAAEYYGLFADNAHGYEDIMPATKAAELWSKLQNPQKAAHYSSIVNAAQQKRQSNYRLWLKLFQCCEGTSPNRIIFELSQKNWIRAAEIDRTMRSMQATHLIVSYYKTVADLPPNDEDAANPAVSYILDDQCDFLICNRRNISQDKPLSSQDIYAHRILFELGNVLISEFPSRDINHSTFKIYKNSIFPNQDIWLIMSYLTRTTF